MSVQRRPDGRWRARFRGPDRKERARHFDKKSEAAAWLAEQASAVNKGNWIDPSGGRQPFAELCDLWLRAHPNKRPTTLARDRSVLEVHFLPALGGVPVARITPAQIRTVVQAMVDRGLKARTVHTNYGVLRAVFSWAVAQDIIGRTPCRGVGLPEIRPVQKPLASAEMVLRLADAVPLEYRVAILLGGLGLRLAEVVGLRVGSIDFLRQSILIEATINEVDGRFVAGSGKTEASQRVISVPRGVLDELAAHLDRTGRTQPDDLVLQAPGGGPMRASNFRARVFNPAVQEVGLEGLTFHRLRHSAGHHMRELGIGLEVIQRRLGHRSIRTTADVYGSLPESVDRSVAGMLDDLYARDRGLNADREAG